MSTLFQPDIFSSPTPRFSPIAAGSEAPVREVLRRFYPALAASAQRLEQFGGNEINSNNFRLACDGTVYLLKRLPAAADAGRIERQLALVDWLRDVHGVRLPALLRTSGGDVLGKDGAGLWCLFEFLEGDFFHGGLEQLVETGREIGRLQVALRHCPPELLPAARWQYFTADDAAVYLGVTERRGEWARIFDAGPAALLEEASDAVQRAWQELGDASASLSALEPLACHCDLHPHNLLMRGSRLAGFIDFESFVAMPAEASLGFATFKLLRQHAVAGALGAQDQDRIRDATRAFLAAMADSKEPCAARPALMRSMALAEIFRRILVIFRLNLRDANRAWNHVLPMHLAGLHELEVILGYARG